MSREPATPVVSVIIVTYQTRKVALRCLRALREACTAVAYEIIVVDNASTDGGADAIAVEFPDVRVVRLERNVGFGQAVNQGAARARGAWLMLLNPDTDPVGDVVSAFVSFADEHPGHGIYPGRTLHPDGRDDGRSCFGLPTLWGSFCFATGLSTVFRRSPWLNPNELPRLDRSQPVEVAAASGCLLLIDAALFARVGGFHPAYFMYSEDVDFCTRAAAHGARPMLVPTAQVLHVGGASSTSVNKRIMVLRGKCTYLRLWWSPRRAAVGRALLATGILVRAAGSRVTGRATYWRDVWAARHTWLPGWPMPKTLEPTEVDTKV